jgi:hypothetical protein
MEPVSGSCERTRIDVSTSLGIGGDLSADGWRSRRSNVYPRPVKRGLVAMTVVGAVLALAGSAAGGGGPAWKAWLCMPGRANDWCSVELTTDIFSATGKHTTIPVSVPSDPSVDCFYVYPTVSTEHRANADLKLQPEERETAITQAAVSRTSAGSTRR